MWQQGLISSDIDFTELKCFEIFSFQVHSNQNVNKNAEEIAKASKSPLELIKILKSVIIMRIYYAD